MPRRKQARRDKINLIDLFPSSVTAPTACLRTRDPFLLHPDGSLDWGPRLFADLRETSVAPR